MGNANPTVSDSTARAYAKRAADIIAEIEAQTGTSHVSPVDMAEWLILKAPHVLQSTVRQYRAALNRHIENMVRTGVTNPEIASKAIGIMQSIRGLGIKGAKTSSNKSKSISKRTIGVLLGRLEKKFTTSRYAYLASVMFQATLVTGLRPVEWFTAKEESDHDQFVLVVQNAKNTNGRSFGKIRKLLIYGKEDIKVIRETLAQLRVLQQQGLGDKGIYTSLRNTIHAVSVFNNGKPVSLYTARHQFVANMKNVLTPGELALLLGHNTTETASRHYGKRRSGHPEFINKATQVISVPELNLQKGA